MYQLALCLGIVVSAFGNTAWSADPIRIVLDGQPRAAVVLPADADGQTEAAARLLVEYVKQSSGAELSIVKGPVPEPAKQPVAIHVGRSEHVDRLHPELDQLDDDGFVIHGVDPSQVIIAGPTPYGTEFGVYEFLERYVGVRWLMPGPDGDDVPARASIEVPVGQVRQEPAFFSRLFSGLRGDWQAKWARRNRMHGRVSFHHYLLHVFPPETYTKTHPDFFPMKDGKTRFLPPTNNTHGWQPCFSAEGSVEEAVKNITRYFDDHPDVPSFSLGVNDSSGHCRCPDCLQARTRRAQLPGSRRLLRLVLRLVQPGHRRRAEEAPRQVVRLPGIQRGRLAAEEREGARAADPLHDLRPHEVDPPRGRSRRPRGDRGLGEGQPRRSAGTTTSTVRPIACRGSTSIRPRSTSATATPTASARVMPRSTPTGARDRSSTSS